MRTVTFGAACSLDGFIARADHSVDWLQWSSDIADITARYWETIDTVLMGRKTFEVGPTKGYPNVKNYVFSRTLEANPHPNVELVRDDAAKMVGALKRAPGKGICVMGGGQLARALFDAGLIDEVGINVHPVLLRSGIPMFPESRQQLDLELVECRPIKNGCVYLMYRVKVARRSRRRGV